MAEFFPDVVKMKAEASPNENQYFLSCESNLGFCFKIICFLFQIYKRVFGRQIFLNSQIVQGLLNNQSKIEPIDSVFRDTSKNTRIINGLNMTFSFLLDFLTQNVIETLTQIKPEFLNLTHFKQFKSILDSHLKWFSAENLNSLMINAMKDSANFHDEDLYIKYFEPNPPNAKSFNKIPQYTQEREKSRK